MKSALRKAAKAGSGKIVAVLLLVDMAYWPLQISPALWAGASVGETVAKETERQSLVGVAIGVVRHGDVVLARGFGFSDAEHQKSVTPETVFNWASCAKALAAVAAMQLVEEKKLNLDVEISQYVPEFPKKEGAITIRRLLCHQSGLPHYGSARVRPSRDLQVRDLDSIDPIIAIRRFSESSLLFQPGTQTAYSSYGYILLSAAIQRAGSQSFDRQIHERIAEPLGMTSLQLDAPLKNQLNWAVGYLKDKSGHVVRAPQTPHAWKAGAGGYKSNISDFARFAEALVNHRLVSRKLTNRMWTPQETSTGRLTAWGLGFSVSSHGDDRIVSIYGQQEGAASCMMLFPKTKDAIVVLSNSGYGDVTVIGRSVASTLATIDR